MFCRGTSYWLGWHQNEGRTDTQTYAETWNPVGHELWQRYICADWKHSMLYTSKWRRQLYYMLLNKQAGLANLSRKSLSVHSCKHPGGESCSCLKCSVHTFNTGTRFKIRFCHSHDSEALESLIWSYLC